MKGNFYDTERVALFIDGANLYATTKSLGFDIDYKRLLKEGSNVVVLERDVAKAFPDSASVNKALRSVLKSRRPRRLTTRLTRTSARTARAG